MTATSDQRQRTPLADDMTLYDVELAGTSLRSEIPTVAGVLVAATLAPTTEECVAAVLSTVEDPTPVLEPPASSIRPISVEVVQQSSRRKAATTTTTTRTTTTSQQEESLPHAQTMIACGLVLFIIIISVAVTSSSGETGAYDDTYDTYHPSSGRFNPSSTQAPDPIPVSSTDIFPYNWRMEERGSPMSSVSAMMNGITLPSVDGWSVGTLEECKEHCQEDEMLLFFEGTMFMHLKDNCICHDSSSSVSCLTLSGYDQGFVLSKVPPPDMCE
jgi:hypothetical protein